MPNVKYHTSNIKCLETNAKCQNQNVKCQKTNAKCQKTNVKKKCQMSYIKYQMSNISWWNNWAILLSFSRFHYSSLSFSFTFFFLTIWQTCCCLCPRPCSCPQTCPRSHPRSLPGKKDLETGVTEGYPGEAKGCFTGYFGLGCGHLKASIPKLLPDPNNNARPCQIGILSWAPLKTRLASFNYM